MQYILIGLVSIILAKFGAWFSGIILGQLFWFSVPNLLIV